MRLGKGVPPVTVQLHNQTVYVSNNGTATASYSINSNGTAVGAGSTLESWLLNGTSSNYEVYASVTSGTLGSGTTGSWLNCGTTRSWSVSNSAQNNSVVTCVIFVQIRDTATQTVQASASITLSAESDNFN